ncbi:hypothetical protein K474DRAFT_1561458, partial [Panus rudis PR-1116 ss-1]
ERVKAVIDFIAEQGFTVGSFLDAFLWGDATCSHNDHIRNTRTTFMRSKEWAHVVQRAYKPPRPSKSKKARPEAARPAMEAFALKTTYEIVDNELQQLDSILRSTGDSYRIEDLTVIHLGHLLREVETRAPKFWSLLNALCRRKGRGGKVIFTNRDPTNSLLLIIALLSYSRNRLCNRFQRLLGIYFKFKGLSARGCDALHLLGITMSSRWLNNAVVKTSNAVMKEMQVIVSCNPGRPLNLGYDNIKLVFQIFSPMFDKRAPDGHGTVAILYYREDAPIFPPSLNRRLQEQRRIGMANPISWDEILELAEQSYPRIEESMIFEALDILLQSDEFSVETYKWRDAPEIQPPKPVRALPIGPQTIPRQFMLRTMPIPEQSYDDNLRVIEKILEQLGYTSSDELRKLGLEQLIFWLGDQLTVSRIRGAQRMRCQDFNSTDRLDFSIPVWQWLHGMMALEKSLHKQYLGSENGFGFLRAFSLLGRFDLIKSGTEGAFHERFEHVLQQVIIAYVRECWLIIAKEQRIDKLEDLRKLSPTRLRDLARKLVDTFGSPSALHTLKIHNDEVRRFAAMFLRDLLQYLALKRANRTGDVGFMRLMLPVMLFRFVGGQNFQYATEILETLQGFHREWPEEICDYIMSHCWLANPHGKRDTFTPIDRITEQGVKDIKVTNPTEGPNADWDHRATLHPVIPIIRQVSNHVEQEFRTWTRYSAHSRP